MTTAAMSTYLENAIADHVLRGITYTPPVTLYIAVFDTTSSLVNLESGILTGEATGGSYARTVVTFAAASGGVSTSNVTVQFPQSTAPWGTLRFGAVMDAATLGNVLYYAQFPEDKVVGTNDILIINSGSIVITHT